MSGNIIATTDADFENDVLKEQIPVLVDFWAEWCGPCKMIAPVLNEIADEYHGRIKVVKVNVDENTKMPAKYNVRGIPTLILFNNGEAVVTKVGAMSKSQLTAFIDEYV